jgi:long-chain acyl-CoA synthetase/monooxygenase
VIVFVNSFGLKGAAADFERVFADTAEFLCAQPGFRSHRLVRSAADPTHYLNIAIWDSEESLRAATGRPEFADHGRRLRELASTDPRFFEPVLERHA